MRSWFYAENTAFELFSVDTPFPVAFCSKSLRQSMPLMLLTLSMDKLLRPVKITAALLALVLSYPEAFALDFSKPLTLREALIAALEQNDDIQIEITGPTIAAAITDQRRAIFDPRFEASYTYRSVERQQNTQEFISSGGSFGTAPRIFDENSHRMNFNAVARLEWGTQIEAGVRSGQVKNSIIRTSAQALFETEHETFIGITVRQPLLQGFGRRNNLIAINIARKNEDVEELRLLATIYGVSAQVATSWYDLLFALAQRDVRRAEVASLREVMEEQMLQVERGLLSMRQFGAAQAELAEAEEQAVQAEINFREQQIEMTRLLGGFKSFGEQALVMPAEELTDNFPEVMVPDSILQLVDRLPEYLQALNQFERSMLEVEQVADLKRPQLDLVGSAGVSGLSGTFRESFEQAGRAEYADFSIGFTVTIPWGNVEAQARHREALERRSRAARELSRTRSRAAAEIRAAQETVAVMHTRLETTRTFREHFALEYEEEMIRLERGETTLIQVAQFRRALADAEVRELAALALLHQNYVRLMAANASLLPHHGVVPIRFFTNR